MKNVLKLLLVSIIMLSPAAFCFAAKEKLQEGDTAPKFSMTTLDGKQETLDSLIGPGMDRSVLVLSFFNTTCEPCKKELPHLTAVYKKYLNDSKVKIRLVGLDTEGKKKIDPHVKKHNIILPVLLDREGLFAGENYGVVQYGRAKVPKLIVISKNKIVKKIMSGFKEGEEEHFESTLVNLIEELKKEKAVKELPNRLTIVYSNSTNGYMESCDCPENPFGGLVRRSTAIKDIRKKGDAILLLDSGDHLSPYPDKLLAEYVFKSFALMDYDALGVGDQDLANGSFWLNNIIENQAYGDLPFLATNIQLCDDKLCWDLTRPTVVKNIGKYKVGIVGILSPTPFFFYPPDKKPAGMKIKNSSSTIKTHVDLLRNEDKVDVVVLLSHSGYNEDQAIARQVPGIDVIIGGHSQTLTEPPLTINNTIIVQAGENGQRLGKLTLNFNDFGKRMSFKNEFVILTTNVADDETIKKLNEEYKIKKKEANKKLLSK